MRRQPTLLPTLVLLGRAAFGLLSPALGLAGLTLLVIAAFSWCTTAGYAAAGLACLVTAVYVEQWRGAPDAGTEPVGAAGALDAHDARFAPGP